MSQQQKTVDMINDLAVLLHSGQDINSALSLLVETTPDEALKAALGDISHGVRTGQTLSNQLGNHPHLFNEFICGIVLAGEASGNLPVTLDRLVDQLERDMALKAKIVNALIYPAILWVVMSVSMMIVLAVVLPQLAVVIDSLNTSPSLLTSVLVTVGNFFNEWGRWLAVALLSLIVICWLLRDDLNLSERFSAWLVKILPLDSLLAKMEFARFSGVLSSLLGSGMPQLNALQIAKHSLKRPASREALKQVITQVSEGQSFGTSLAQFTDLGSVYAHSIRAGEEGAQLASTLERLSTRLENEFTLSSQRLAAIVEPVLVVVMGLIIGVVVYAIFTALQSVGQLPL